MTTANYVPYVLGLDLGTNSLGWALIRTEGDGNRLLRTGVRIFAEGFASTKSGEQPRSAPRRQARLARRQIERRARRMAKLFHDLQRGHLLPSGPSKSPAERDALLKVLDRAIDARRIVEWLPFRGPYTLRAKALDHELEPFEFGRALYHLAQRRGYNSNRRVVTGSEESVKAQAKEAGVVETGIQDLEQRMTAAGARTLGEYLAGTDPRERRYRQQWTSRKWYIDEFERIWAAQASRRPEMLTVSLHGRIRDTIFFQRPLKAPTNLVGGCPHERRVVWTRPKGELVRSVRPRKRAPKALLDAQTLMVWQRVNDLRIGRRDEVLRPLTDVERSGLAEALQTTAEMTVTSALKEIGLRGRYSTNLGEEDKSRKIRGNATGARIAGAVGVDRWKAMPRPEQDRVVESLLALDDEVALARWGRRSLRLDASAATKLARTTLPDGYMSFSAPAIQKMLPIVQGGRSIEEARREVYPQDFAPSQGVAAIPPVREALTELRNPVVERSLTELRKVVNAVIREYGTPSRVHVELARDLKKTSEQRREIESDQRKREFARDRAAAEAREVLGRDPRSADIERILLAYECGFHCPYTGRSFSMRELFIDSAIDVDHIIPFTRSLDDSFLNKTLCSADHNRMIKRNLTPVEAHDEAELAKIVERVKQFTGDRHAVREKLRRFQLTAEQVVELFEGFKSRQLNDTRYASKLTVRLLDKLLGTVDGVRDHGLASRPSQGERGDACGDELRTAGGREWPDNCSSQARTRPVEG